ncbi:MAG: HAD-IA family hydrolase [Proteobacteria bacterium]|nr:HAD-IA family hydrolase [Pseudomonadota bacterium]
MTRLPDGKYNAVLFDLDGTLVDTAPDMVGVLQELQRDRGVEPVPYEIGRSHVSHGAVGLLTLAFPEENVTAQGPLLCEYINRYANSVCSRTQLFAGLDDLIDRLDTAACPWGVVTNKPAHLTEPILEQLELADRIAAVVSGDTLPTRKPDPAQLLHACEIMGVVAEETIYVGDAKRDVEAGHRAGMATIAAAYGYIPADDDPQHWDADLIAADTEELTRMVLKAVNLVP